VSSDGERIPRDEAHEEKHEGKSDHRHRPGAGNRVFMMSKSAYLFDAGDHNGPHVMFFTALNDSKDWGAGASGSPVFAGPQITQIAQISLRKAAKASLSKTESVSSAESVDGIFA
jgi:hypothetical protein